MPSIARHGAHLVSSSIGDTFPIEYNEHHKQHRDTYACCVDVPLKGIYTEVRVAPSMHHAAVCLFKPCQSFLIPHHAVPGAIWGASFWFCKKHSTPCVSSLSQRVHPSCVVASNVGNCKLFTVLVLEAKFSSLEEVLHNPIHDVFSSAVGSDDPIWMV